MRRRRRREGQGGQDSAPFVLPSFAMERIPPRASERNRRKGWRGRETERVRETAWVFLDDFLITRSQSRVSARRKRHFARERPADNWRVRRREAGDANGDDPGFMLSREKDSRDASTCRRNWIGGKERRGEEREGRFARYGGGGGDAEEAAKNLFRGSANSHLARILSS